MPRALKRALLRVGKRRAARMPMMAMTTSSSIRVNAFRLLMLIPPDSRLLTDARCDVNINDSIQYDSVVQLLCKLYLQISRLGHSPDRTHFVDRNCADRWRVLSIGT